MFYYLTGRYKLTYDEIKEVVRNSIEYSNIEEVEVKRALLQKLEDDFDTFEKKITDFYNPIVFMNDNNLNQFKFMSLNN